MSVLDSSDADLEGRVPKSRSSHSCMTGLAAGSPMCFKPWKKLNITCQQSRGWIITRPVPDIPSFLDAAVLQGQQAVFDGEQLVQHSLAICQWDCAEGRSFPDVHSRLQGAVSYSADPRCRSRATRNASGSLSSSPGHSHIRT